MITVPTVAVVIPTYNRAHNVGDAIRSALDQTDTQTTVFVVDDGSTDDTSQIVMNIASAEPRIRFHQIAHGGVARARNVALDSVTDQEFVAFLDSDDQWLPDHLKTAIAAFRANDDLGGVFSRIRTIDLSGTWSDDRLTARDARVRVAKQYASCQIDSFYMLDREKFWRALLLSELCPHTSTVVVRASALHGIRFNTALTILEDCQLFLELASGNVFGFFDEVHTLVRRYGDNLTGTNDLSSDKALKHQESGLAYATWKLSLVRDTYEQGIVNGEIANAAYFLGLGYAARRQLRKARKFYALAFYHRPSWMTAKGLFAAQLPVRFYDAMHGRYWPTTAL